MEVHQVIIVIFILMYVGFIYWIESKTYKIRKENEKLLDEALERQKEINRRFNG